jgi:selenophosphate synthase
MKILKMTMGMKVVLTQALGAMTDEEVAKQMTDEAKAAMVEAMRADIGQQFAAGGGEVQDFTLDVTVVEV